jgi:DNA-binding HxlR family transcriptional regulator
MTITVTGDLATRGDVALGDACPMDRAVRAIGNRPALLLMREVFYGASRFDSLAKRVGVSEAVAAQRLRELVELGLLAREPYREPGQRTRHAYVLTDRGRDLLPVVLALVQWGAAHTDGSAPLLTHAGCGEAVQVEVRCAEGHVVAEQDIVLSAPDRG